MNDSGNENHEADLTLPKTGIFVGNSKLWRNNEDGSVLMQIKLSEINRVAFSRPINPTSIVFVAVAAGLGAIGWYVSETNWLSVVLYCIAVVVGGFGLLAARYDRLTIERASGSPLVINCDEQPDEVEQFTLSLEEYLRQHR